MKSNSFKTKIECELIGQGIRSLKNAVVVPGCTILNLHGNDLYSLQGISETKTIIELNLSSNSFVSLDLPELASMTELQVLDLGGNVIDTLQSAPFLPGIMQLSLAFNNLKSLTGISENFPDLEILDIRGNILTGPNVLNELTRLDRLRHLALSGGSDPNPVCSDACAIENLFNDCPCLETIDNLERRSWIAANTVNPPTFTRDIATSPFSLTSFKSPLDTALTECEENTIITTSDERVRDHQKVVTMKTPRFDALAERFKARKLSDASKVEDVDTSAFSLGAEYRSPEDLEILDVYMTEVGSPRITPSAGAAATEGWHPVHEDVGEESPNPRHRNASLPYQLRNPWMSSSEVTANYSSTSTPAIDPLLAADMRSLLGALRKSGISNATTSLNAPSDYPNLNQTCVDSTQGLISVTELKSPDVPPCDFEGGEASQNELKEKANTHSPHVNIEEKKRTEERKFDSYELEIALMQLAQLETKLHEGRLCSEAAAEASATALREAERRILLVAEEARIERERAHSASANLIDAQNEILNLKQILAANAAALEAAKASAIEAAQQRDALRVLHAEEMQRDKDAHTHELHALLSAKVALTAEVADANNRYTSIVTQNSQLLTSNDEYRIRAESKDKREAELLSRINAEMQETNNYKISHAKLQAELAMLVQERDNLKRDADARVRDWERLFTNHTEMLALERARSHEAVEAEKVARNLYDKLERRFKQLERAFEQALARSDTLEADLAVEREKLKRSHDTVAELGKGIHKLQAALQNASTYKHSALQLQAALLQARAENDSLLLQLRDKKQFVDKTQRGMHELSHDDATGDSLSPEEDSILRGTELEVLRQRIEELEQESRRTMQLLHKADELSELLSKKERELLHVIQVKETILSDQAAAIGDLKERISVFEADTINAESVITALEQQIETLQGEIARLQKLDGTQTYAASHLLKLVGDYRVAVRTQLEQDSDESGDSDQE